MNHAHSAGLAGTMMVMLAAALGLSEPPPQSKPDQAKPAEPPLLSGPQVSAPVARTLVQLDAQGRFVRIEARPEQAALIMLSMDGSQREEARYANEARLTAIGGLLLDNLDLAIESAEAQEAGKGERTGELSRQLYDKFDPEHTRDPLLPALEKLLEPEAQKELHRLVDDYWKAWIDWEVRGSKDKSDEVRKRTQNRLTFGMFQQDLRQAYERTLRPYRARMQAINQIAQPTDEQKQAIRTIMLDFIRETRAQPTPEQNREAARKIYEALDDGRRQKVFESLLMRLGT